MWKKCLTALIGLVSLSHHAIAHERHDRTHHHRIAITAHYGAFRHKVQESSPPVKAVDHTNRVTWIDPIALEATGRRTESLCLALGMYQEARSLSIKDQLAVGHVILNRVKASGLTACQVLWQGHGSQFQWTRRPVSALIPREHTAWKQAQWDAWRLLTYRLPDTTHGATLFYNPKLAHPRWAHHGTRTAFLGHVFIRTAAP